MLKRFFPILLIGIAALLLRLYNLTAISLWHDEAFSALLIKYSWSEMLYRIGLDVHPPLYYIALRFWHYVFGHSLLSLRGFSVACGVASVVLTYYLVQKYFASPNYRRAAIFSSLLVAANFFQIQSVGSEARMYTFGVLLNLAAAGSLMQALHLQYLKAGTRNRMVWLWYFLFAAFSAAMLYTHYYLAFSLIALGVYGLGYHLWQAYKDKNIRGSIGLLFPFIGSCILVGLFYLPWLKTFLFQLGQVQGGYWIPPLDRWSIPSTVWDISLGLHTSGLPTRRWLVFATILSALMIIGFLRKVRQPEKWLIVLSLLAPFAGAVGFYLINQAQGNDSSVFLVRYFAFAGVFYAITLGIWLAHWKWRSFAWLILLAVVGINLFALNHHWRIMDPDSKPGMDGASSYLNEQVMVADKIIVGSSFEFFNFKYYNRTPVAPKLYSGGHAEVSAMPHYAGTAILTKPDLAPDFNTAASSGDTVWIIWTNAFGGQKPTPPANWQQIEERGYDDGRPYLGTTIYVTQYKIN